MGQEVVSTKLSKPVDEQDHAQGPASAVVTMVEYGDYQCEDSGAAYSIVKEIQHRSGDWLRFVYRHFPLTKVHEHSQNAAEAAEAAGAQDMFWEMHDFLFQHQNELDDESLMEHAEEIGLDVDRFERDLSEHASAGQVSGHQRSGVRSGIDHTPAFFINSKLYQGPIDVEAMLAAIEDAASDISEE